MFWISHYTLWCCTVRISRWVSLSLFKTRIMLVIRLNRFSLVASGENGWGGKNKIKIRYRNTSDFFKGFCKKMEILAFQFALISHIILPSTAFGPLPACLKTLFWKAQFMCWMDAASHRYFLISFIKLPNGH